VTEQSEGGDKSGKASEEQLEKANGELQDLQRELVAANKERDESKALVQELEKKNATLLQDNQETEESEDLKSQLLANKITVQQNKKLNELLQKKVERLTASETSLKKELGEAQQDKESKELLHKKVESLTASEAFMKKEVTEAQESLKSKELICKEMERSAANALEKGLKDVQEVKELKEQLQKKAEHLAASEASLKKLLEDAKRKPKGDHGTAAKPHEEEAKEVKDELVLAEQEVKRSRSRIQSLEKQVQQAHKETESLKREADSADAQLAVGSSLPQMKPGVAEKEAKRCRVVIEKLAKTNHQQREEIALLKGELETRKRARDPNADSIDAQLAEGGDSPGPKKPRADEV
jgi:chromosome segregation ATPase